MIIVSDDLTDEDENKTREINSFLEEDEFNNFVIQISLENLLNFSTGK